MTVSVRETPNSVHLCHRKDTAQTALTRTVENTVTSGLRGFDARPGYGQTILMSMTTSQLNKSSFARSALYSQKKKKKKPLTTTDRYIYVYK